MSFGRFRASPTFCWLAIVASVLVTTGCDGKAPNVYRVTGTVTRGGKPIPNLTVSFIPHSGRPSFAQTDAVGHYNLGFTRDIQGALPGKHTVVVGVPVAVPGPTAGISHEELKAVLAKYGSRDQATLEKEVSEDGQVIDLQLD